MAGIIGFGAFTMGFFLFLLSLTQNFALILIIVFMIGLGMMLQLSSTNTVIQTLLEDDNRGTVVSFLIVAQFATAPFGSLMMGSMAQHFGLSRTFLINGLICFIGSLFFIKKSAVINAHIISYVQMI